MRRLYEILPGALAWLTIILMVGLSRYLPTPVAIFIILFDTYWLIKTVYLSFHLRAAFRALKMNLKIDWLERLQTEQSGAWETLYHLVILPMYREPYEVLRESFDRLRAANYPKEKLFVVLSLEERAAAETQGTADRIQKEFGKHFGNLLVTVHPDGLPGEMRGKGSNETWGAKQAKEQLLDPRGILYEHVLVSVFDVDTQVYPDYFARLAHAYLTTENPTRAIYQPIPLFVNNIYESPALARVVAFSATFWQMMQQARPERLTTFSSQSIPFRTLLDIGYWETNIVSEDSRVFWQCFFRYGGNFRTIPLAYPVSMDANVTPTFWGTIRNLYKQQRRWGWGVENIPYVLTQFRMNASIPRRMKWYWTFNLFEGFHSWATHSLMIFALGWLPLALGGAAFSETLLSYNLPSITRFIITLSMVGIASSAILGILLLPPRPSWFRPRHYALYFFQWLLLPITLIALGAIPGIDAQTRLMLGGRFRLGFWVTPKQRLVSTP